MYTPKAMINACHQAHQGGSDFILCNLICLNSDFKAKNMDKETILKKLDEFIERFKYDDKARLCTKGLKKGYTCAGVVLNSDTVLPEFTLIKSIDKNGDKNG
jgi:hypothetical protein